MGLNDELAATKRVVDPNKITPAQKKFLLSILKQTGTNVPPAVLSKMTKKQADVAIREALNLQAEKAQYGELKTQPHRKRRNKAKPKPKPKPLTFSQLQSSLCNSGR